MGGISPVLRIKKPMPREEKGRFPILGPWLQHPCCPAEASRHRSWSSEADTPISPSAELEPDFFFSFSILDRLAAATQRDKRHRCEVDVGAFQVSPCPGALGVGMGTGHPPRRGRGRGSEGNEGREGWERGLRMRERKEGEERGGRGGRRGRWGGEKKQDS